MLSNRKEKDDKDLQPISEWSACCLNEVPGVDPFENGVRGLCNPSPSEVDEDCTIEPALDQQNRFQFLWSRSQLLSENDIETVSSHHEITWSFSSTGSLHHNFSEVYNRQTDSVKHGDVKQTPRARISLRMKAKSANCCGNNYLFASKQRTTQNSTNRFTYSFSGGRWGSSRFDSHLSSAPFPTSKKTLWKTSRTNIRTRTTNHEELTKRNFKYDHTKYVLLTYHLWSTKNY